MRHEITFDKNEPFVTIRTLGELSAEGHLLFLKELITRPEWRAGMNALVDHRAASLAAITPGKTAERHPGRRGTLRHCFVRRCRIYEGGYVEGHDGAGCRLQD
jgi:hypothetical protein